MINSTHTNRSKKIGEIIKDMFEQYDRLCFKHGTTDMIEAARKEARFITDELIKFDFDIDIIEMAMKKVIKDFPPKNENKPVTAMIPKLPTIVLVCRRILNERKPVEAEDKISEPIDWEKYAQSDDPDLREGAKRHLEYIKRRANND